MRRARIAQLRRIAIAALSAGTGAALLVVGRPADRPATMPPGTLLVAALVHSLSTVTAVVGDPVEAKLIHPVMLPDGSLVPIGTVVRGEVTYVHSGRRSSRAPELGLRFTTLDIEAHAYAITAVRFHVHARPSAYTASTAAGGRASMGGSVRRVAPAGTEALRHGPAGAAVAPGDAVHRDGRELVLPKGQRLQIRLAAPVQVRHLRHPMAPTSGS